MAKKKYSYRKKPTGERNMFQQIWIDRIHCSEVTGHPISAWEANNMLCFAHVLDKKRFPLFRLYDKNICLLTYDEHTFYDNQTEEELEKRIAKGEYWEYLFELRDKLIIEYKEAEAEYNLHGCFLKDSKWYFLSPEENPYSPSVSSAKLPENLEDHC